MPTEFHVLPDHSGLAAQNMAYDFLMLQRYQPADAIRIRHYDWVRDAFTFGLSQKFSYVESEVQNPSLDICRRPTGGGIVDHTDDWTYALVIPASHPMAQGQPLDTYKAVHDAMISAMNRQGIEAILNLSSPNSVEPGICFAKPELYDVVLKDFPSKVAGAAQKRTKAGFLLQGSIWKPTVSHLDWQRFYNDFIIELAGILDGKVQYAIAPNWDTAEEDKLLSQFESDEWNQRR